MHLSCQRRKLTAWCQRRPKVDPFATAESGPPLVGHWSMLLGVAGAELCR